MILSACTQSLQPVKYTAQLGPAETAGTTNSVTVLNAISNNPEEIIDMNNVFSTIQSPPCRCVSDTAYKALPRKGQVKHKTTPTKVTTQ